MEATKTVLNCVAIASSHPTTRLIDGQYEAPTSWDAATKTSLNTVMLLIWESWNWNNPYWPHQAGHLDDVALRGWNWYALICLQLYKEKTFQAHASPSVDCVNRFCDY